MAQFELIDDAGLLEDPNRPTAGKVPPTGSERVNQPTRQFEFIDDAGLLGEGATKSPQQPIGATPVKAEAQLIERLKEPEEPQSLGQQGLDLLKRAKQYAWDEPAESAQRGFEQLGEGKFLRGTGNLALSGIQAFGAPVRFAFGDPARNLMKEAGGGETAQYLAGMGGEIAGGFGVSGLLRNLPGIGVRIASEILGFGPQWRESVDDLGHEIVSRMPKWFRAGRGTPKQFREARAQMEAEIANSVEKAIELGSKLKGKLSPAEKLRADQLLRGGITTGQTPAAVAEGVKPIRVELDRIQDELLELGRLAPETVEKFQEHFGAYLARLYQTKEFIPRTPIVVRGTKPIRAGSERLMMRGERISVEIPSLEDEMNRLARLLGPEAEFRRTFRGEARALRSLKKTTKTEVKEERVISGEPKTVTETVTEGMQGETTQIPLSGATKKLEDVVQGALEARGMMAGEAQAAINRLKAAAAKMAREGEDIKVPGGGTTTERTTTTITSKVESRTETIKTIIDSLGINKAQRAALHAYYDVISRAAAKSKRLKIDGKVYRIKPIMDADSGLERVEALEELLDAGFTVESRVGNKVKMFRDIPEEVRVATAGKPVIRGGKELTLGEMERMVDEGITIPLYETDWRGRMVMGGKKIGTGMGEMRGQPGYTGGKSIAQAGRESAVVRFMKSVADNSEWTRDTVTEGFKEMPKDVKRMANLSGKHVRSDIAEEINEMVRVKTDGEKIVNRITSLWKIGKVTNPATIMRNFMSSMEMARWGGLSPFRSSGTRSYGAAMRGFRGSDKEMVGLLDEAKRAGVFRSGYNQGEINALADGFLQSKSDNGLLRILDGVTHMVTKSKVGQAYGSVDAFYKGALYIHARKEMGYGPKLASAFAKKYGIDYADISPFVRFMREIPLGSPFLTFASKAIPLAIETSVKHPVRFWTLPAALLGMQELSRLSLDQDQAELAQIQKMGRLKSPRYVLLPTRTKEGRNQFLDLGYILPYGDILEAIDYFQGGGGASIGFAPFGGPFGAVAEILANKSLFTGEKIYEETDTWTQTYTKISDHMLKSLLPTLAPPIPGTGFRGGYSVEAFRKTFMPEWQGFEPMVGLPALEEPISKSDYLGRQRGALAVVASKIFGLNVKDVSLMDLKRFGLLEFQDRMAELNKKMARTARQQITPAQKDTQIKKLMDQYRALVEKTKEHFARVKLSEAPAQTPPGPQGPIKYTDDAGLLK